MISISFPKKKELTLFMKVRSSICKINYLSCSSKPAKSLICKTQGLKQFGRSILAGLHKSSESKCSQKLSLLPTNQHNEDILEWHAEDLKQLQSIYFDKPANWPVEQ